MTETVTDCNCSICRRYGVLWAYYAIDQVQITGETDFYVWGDRQIQFHRCRACGCVTHWAPVSPERNRMGINSRMMSLDIRAQARVRRLDGADTWEYQDE